MSDLLVAGLGPCPEGFVKSIGYRTFRGEARIHEGQLSSGQVGKEFFEVLHTPLIGPTLTGPMTNV